jgi:cell division protein FtsB
MEQLIAGLGFPVACCLGLAYYVKYQNEQMIQDNKEEDYKIKVDESQKKISILEAENKTLKQELSITQDAVNELIFNFLNM